MASCMEHVAARWERARQLAGTSVGSVMYAVLDVIVDGYFDAIDGFERYYDDVADQVFGESPIEPAKHRQWFEMRKSLNQFDRIIGPLAEALDDGGRRRPRALPGRRLAVPP